MCRKHLGLYAATVFGLLALSGTPAMANHIDTAKVTPSCSSYTIEFNASALVVGKTYTVKWAISGLGPTIDDSKTFTAKSTTYDSGPITKSIGPLTGDFTPSGTATLVGLNTIDMTFLPPSISCPVCLATTTNGSNFNGTPINGGTHVWFNANFTASGIPSTGATVTFTASTINFTANGVPFSLEVPNGEITFSPRATCSSTTFDTKTNTWMTTVPVSGDDEIFLTGLAWPVPSGGLPGGINPVTWEGTFGADTPGASANWKWGAAVYTRFTTNYNALAIKPAHQTSCGTPNGDHAGTPEGVNNNNVPWKTFVVGGARGGGGSNWTGSWSGSLSVEPVCH